MEQENKTGKSRGNGKIIKMAMRVNTNTLDYV